MMLAGCSSISERTHAYLGSPSFSPTDAAKVKILPSEPAQPKDRLGEIMLHIEGNPSREAVDKRLISAAAKLGAEAVFVTYDRMVVFPVVYAGRWGPVGVSHEMGRDVVAVAIRYK